MLAVQDNVLFNFYNSSITSWTGGQERCVKDGGHLVTLETERKWEFITREIQNLSNPSQNEWFIGLTDMEHGKSQTWQWITGEPLNNSHWQEYEPSGDGECVVIAKEYPQGTYGGYNDLRCDTHKAFICEVVNITTGNSILLK